MRPVRCLLLYLMVIFLGAALLAPWLYWLAQWAAGQSTRLAWLSTQPFHRYVNRSLLGLALVGLRPFLRSIEVDSWPEVGVVKPAGHWPKLAIGFGFGFASLACVALLAIGSGARIPRTDLSAMALAGQLLAAAFSAVVVGFLEELLFRGTFFGTLRKACRWTTALAMSSVFYALVHFLQKPAAPPKITWTSGLELLPRMLHGFVEIQVLVPGFVTLLVAGTILGLAYQRTGNLYLSMGLHAGWIFWLKFYSAVTVPAANASQWFWGSGKLIDGWLGLGVLLPGLFAVWFFTFEPEPVPDAA